MPCPPFALPIDKTLVTPLCLVGIVTRQQPAVTATDTRFHSVFASDLTVGPTGVLDYAMNNYTTLGSFVGSSVIQPQAPPPETSPMDSSCLSDCVRCKEKGSLVVDRHAVIDGLVCVVLRLRVRLYYISSYSV